MKKFQHDTPNGVASSSETLMGDASTPPPSTGEGSYCNRQSNDGGLFTTNDRKVKTISKMRTYWATSLHVPVLNQCALKGVCLLHLLSENIFPVLTRALLGGGGVWTPPPSGFSRIAKKRRRAAPPGFHPPYRPSFPQLLWKFRPKAMWGQVTRSGQVTQLQNNFPIAPRLQCFRESYETFGIWWGHQCLQNVYLGFLISVTSGQVIFATSPL